MSNILRLIFGCISAALTCEWLYRLITAADDLRLFGFRMDGNDYAAVVGASAFLTAYWLFSLVVAVSKS